MLVTDIVVFYLVLRGLDTVEDDMTAFDDIQVKISPIVPLVRECIYRRREKTIVVIICVSPSIGCPFPNSPPFATSGEDQVPHGVP